MKKDSDLHNILNMKLIDYETIIHCISKISTTEYVKKI